MPTDETVSRKLSLIRRCLPARSLIDFGGMWEVDGFYSREAKRTLRVSVVTMVDIHVSENWGRNPEFRKGIDFRRGDFSNELFMKTIRKRYDVALSYDVLPHQIDLRHTLGLMLSKAKRFFIVSQPILPDHILPFRNCLVLLSGSRAPRLIPFREKWTRKENYWRNFLDPQVIDPRHWLWGMTPSFIESLMAGFGWRLLHQESWRGWLPRSSVWRLCGLIFKKKTRRPA